MPGTIDPYDAAISFEGMPAATVSVPDHEGKIFAFSSETMHLIEPNADLVEQVFNPVASP